MGDSADEALHNSFVHYVQTMSFKESDLKKFELSVRQGTFLM